jgi:hypothetical protein
MTNTKLKTQERRNQNASFVNGKKHTPPETKCRGKFLDTTGLLQ